jgi:hypothetical protein
MPKRNNNLFQTQSDDFNDNNVFNDGTEGRMVPVGYFNKGPNSMANPSEVNTTSRLSDNNIVSTIGFPKLNNTIRTETLYSIKSQANNSPHARIMQTIEKRKKKKHVNPMVTNSPVNKPTHALPPRSKHVTHTKNFKPKGGRNTEGNNSKQHYEITTIVEDDESSTQHFTRTQQRSMQEGSGYAKQNGRYKSLNPDLEKVAHNTSQRQLLDDNEHFHNSSQNRQSNNFEASSSPNRKHHMSSNSRLTDNKTEEAISSQKHNVSKSGLPKLGGNIPGFTTTNGTFTPYTYSVSQL